MATQSRQQGLKKYQALIHISVPWHGENKDRNTSLAVPGEIVELTEEEAQNLMTRHRVPVIRPVAEGSEPISLIRGMDLSGRLRQPPPPPVNDPNYDGPRPDPPGSSRIQVLQDVGVGAEGTDPVPGTEQSPAGAIDLPPGTRISV